MSKNSVQAFRSRENADDYTYETIQYTFFYVSFLQVVDLLPQTELSLVNYVRLLNQKGASELS